MMVVAILLACIYLLLIWGDQLSQYNTHQQYNVTQPEVPVSRSEYERLVEEKQQKVKEIRDAFVK